MSGNWERGCGTSHSAEMCHDLRTIHEMVDLICIQPGRIGADPEEEDP